LYSEFRDGNVPAGHEQLRVLQTSLGHLPASVTKVSLRSDTAGYQEELLLYCGEGKDLRFGMTDFAMGADVTDAFRVAVQVTAESEWKPLIRMFEGKPQETDQEWAEICYVPNWGLSTRRRRDTAGVLPVPGDPRAAAPVTLGRSVAIAAPDAGIRPEGDPQDVREW
jgi:hypothetical protein